MNQFEQIIAVCERFEKDYLGGLAPRIEDHLGHSPGEARRQLLIELVMTERDLLGKSGWPVPSAEELCRRFPEFAPDIAELFADSDHGPTASADVRPQLPDIPGFEVVGELGRGTMGVVYKARRLRLNRVCALKMISHARSEAAARLQTEAEAVARVRHPGIVQLYGIGDYQGHPFLELEYVDGGTLAQALDGTPLAARPAVKLVEALAQAVAEAHRLGIVHRDLKPSNVLLTADKRPMITDFGLSRCIENGSDLTRTESVLGTPSYMAPEQADGRARQAGPAADVYSLGAIFYELLTGRPPFRSATILQTLDQVKNSDPVPPSDLQPGLARDAETICLKCLAKNPAGRYPSAQELADDLRRFLDWKPILARRVGACERSWQWCRRRPAIAGLGTALVLTVLTAFVAIVVMWRRAETLREAAERNQAQALIEKRHASIESARRALELGVENCEKGEVGRGILWMARSLMLTPPDEAELRWAIRAKLAHWRLGLAELNQLIVAPHEVNDVKFTPDGALVLASMGIYYDPRGFPVQSWAAATGLAVGLPLMHDGATAALAFSPDARKLYTASFDRTVRSWDATDGRPLARFVVTATGEGGHMRLRPDGWVLAAADGARVRLIDPETGNSLSDRSFENRGEILQLDWSPDGRLLAAADKAGTVALWDVEGGRLDHEFRVNDGYAMTVRFSPDGKFLLAGGTDHMTHLYDLATRRQVAIPTSDHRDAVGQAVFHPGGMIIGVGSTDGEARIVNLARGELVAQPLPHGNLVQGIDFHPAGRSLATGSWDRGLRLWSLPSGYAPAYQAFGSLSGDAAVFAPDGVTVWVARGSSVQRFAADGRAVGPQATHGQPIVGIQNQPNGGRVLATIGRNTVQFWDAATMTPLPGVRLVIHPDAGPHQGIFGATFLPDGQTFLTCGADRAVRRWDVATGRSLGVLVEGDDILRAMAISADGRVLLTGDWQGHIRRWDVATGAPLGATLRHGGQVNALAFHPDGHCFVSASVDGTAQVWDASSGRRLGPSLNHRQALTHVAFDPTGRFVATASQDRVARLWDVATGTPLGPPIRHPDAAIRSQEFRADGSALLTVDGKKRVHIWPLPPLPEDQPDRLALWAETATGLAMDKDGVITTLEVDRWGGQRDALRALGGLPFAPHPDADLDWQAGQAELATTKGDTFAARWHRARVEELTSPSQTADASARGRLVR